MTTPASATTTARLTALLADARTRARATRRRVLVSLVERTPALDALDVLEALASVAERDGQGEVPERMYWTRPADRFSLAGFGAVVALRPRGADRFAAIDREWAALRDDAVIDDLSGGAARAGPLLMGGFAFEPDGARTDRWQRFPSARLFLPRIQIAAAGEELWLTLNLLVGANGEPDIDLPSLLALRGSALAASTTARRRSAASAPQKLARTEAHPKFAWRAAVDAAVAAIRADTLEKVVLAREVGIVAPRDFDVAATLRQLRTAHEASYVFGYWHGVSAFVGASPELLVSVERGEVHASSLAGSVARGATAAADASLAGGLMASAKDRVEHEVVRRALCADLAQFCDDVVADDEPSLLSLPQVHHLYTDVRAQLRAGNSLLDLVAQLHPTPAVGGEPRDAALDFIREHEGMDRGWYAAPIGWLQRERGEFAVALRSALITGREAVLFAGCGIVADSNADDEYAESLLKLRPMEMALAASVIARDGTPPKRAVAGGGAAR